MKSKIEWTQQTWNPIVGCSVVSPGCTNCYAMKMAWRIRLASEVKDGASPYCGTVRMHPNGMPVWTGAVRLVEHKLTEPLRRRKPTMYFVNSMSDLFHESVPDEWIDQVFAVMALAPQHTFQVLTKRSKRMRNYLDSFGPDRPDNSRMYEIDRVVDLLCADLNLGRHEIPHWPLRNVWLGVSTENQALADERIPDLLATLAAVRFISAEPLLGPIDLTSLPFPKSCDCVDQGPTLNALNATVMCGGCCEGPERINTPTLDWIIVGGESGAGARPMVAQWVRDLRDQCANEEKPFFFKQWGGVRKKVAGRLLDGAIHDAMPAAAPSCPQERIPSLE